jgi:hypothetical protein
MARPTEAHREVAQQLLARSEAPGGKAEDPAASASRLYEALFRALAPVIGANGFRALFARAVKLTSADHPGLEAAVTTGEPAGTNVAAMERVAVCLAGLPPAAATETATDLYATLLGLLSGFIGDSLVRQLVKRALPGTDETASKETE